MCCQPLCFIFFFFLPPRPLYPGKAFWGSGGWLRRGETEEWSTEGPRVVGVEVGRFVAPVPPVMRWSLIDLSMWSHLAQKDGAPTCSPSWGGRWGHQERWAGLHTWCTHTRWDLMISRICSLTHLCWGASLSASYCRSSTLIHQITQCPHHTPTEWWWGQKAWQRPEGWAPSHPKKGNTHSS